MPHSFQKRKKNVFQNLRRRRKNFTESFLSPSILRKKLLFLSLHFFFCLFVLTQTDSQKIFKKKKTKQNSIKPFSSLNWWWFSSKSCLTLCGPTDCNPPGSSVRGISQAQILEWVAISSSRGSSWPGDRIRVSWVSGTGWRILYR